MHIQAHLSLCWFALCYTPETDELAPLITDYYQIKIYRYSYNALVLVAKLPEHFLKTKVCGFVGLQIGVSN